MRYNQGNKFKKKNVKLKSYDTLSSNVFPLSPLVGEVDENGAVVDAKQPGPLPHG